VSISYADITFRVSTLRAVCLYERTIDASAVFRSNCVTKLLFTVYVLTLIEIRDFILVI
jgi:hypothetical protein